MRSDFSHHFSDFIVTLNRAQIIKHLKANRGKHVETYEEAKKGYFKKAEAALKERLLDISAGKLVKLNFDLKLPVCYVEQYDDLIQMIEMAKEDEHELSMAQYRCIVDDAWSWTDTFNITNSVYLVS